MHRVVPSEPCPELNCPESEQITLSDRCCKVCRGMEKTSPGLILTTVEGFLHDLEKRLVQSMSYF